MPEIGPIRPRVRWALRITYAIPVVVVTLSTQRGASTGATSDLLERAHAIEWGSSDLSWAPHAFPPIPAALLFVLDYSMVALSLVAGVAVALLLVRLTSTLVRSGQSPVAVGAVVATLLLSPPVYVLVSERPDQALGIALVVFAMDAAVGFVRRGSTRSGMEAGLALGAAVFTTSGAWLYVVGVVAAAVVLTLHARPRSVHVPLATVAVLVFPAAATSVFWVYIAWWFNGHATVALRQLWVIPDGVPSSAWANEVMLAVAAAPVLVLVIAFCLSTVPIGRGSSRVLAAIRSAAWASAGQALPTGTVLIGSLPVPTGLATAPLVISVPDLIPALPASPVQSQHPGGLPVSA